jgi:hypothetical protein
MTFVQLSGFLEQELHNPVVERDRPLQLWCLVAKGYTDIEIDYRTSKRDWLEAQEIANALGESGWANVTKFTSLQPSPCGTPFGTPRHNGSKSNSVTTTSNSDYVCGTMEKVSIQRS